MAASTKDLNISIIVGDHQQPNTRVSVSMYSNYSECQDLFSKTQGMNQENDLVIQISFPTKSGLDDFTLGENIGFFKNKLNLVSDGMKTKYSNIESERDYVTYNKLLKLTFGWEPNNNTTMFNDLNEMVTNVRKFGIQSGELSLEINQRIPTSNYDSDEPKLSGRFTGNVKSNEMLFNSGVREFLQNNPYTFPGPGLFGCLFMTGNVELKGHNLEDLVDMGLVPWPQEIPRFCGFNGLKNFALPFVGEGLNGLPRDEGGINIYALITELYEKIYNSITGISEIKIGFKNHIVSIKFTGFDLFNGYFPDIDTLKNLGQQNFN
jgi:hypothetical protein